MPLFYQHNINHNAKLAIWHISEPEDFFLKTVPLQNEITHWHKRLQHLAGRYLLQELYPDFPYHLIEIAETRKPFLPNEKYHFSISHCGDYAAVLVSKDLRVGIDIELITPKIQPIKHKFLSTKEQKLLNAEDIQLLTLLWSGKEAVYKWYGKGELDFKKHMIIEKLSIDNDHGIVYCRFLKAGKKRLIINFKFFEKLCVAWIAQ